MLPRMVAWLVALMPSAVFSVEKEFSMVVLSEQTKPEVVFLWLLQPEMATNSPAEMPAPVL
jgi:hypothetical protein